MDVSVIIVNYNTMELTRSCLKSIYDNTHDINYEIFVVDNASSDGSVEMIKNEFPDVILLQNKHNLGFGKANNVAIKKSNAKYIFLLNSDTVLLNNSVKLFYDFMEEYKEKNIGVLGTILLNKEMQPTMSYGKFFRCSTFLKEEIRYFAGRNFRVVITLLKTIIKYQQKETVNYINDEVFEVEYISGADLFIPRVILNEVNGFDEDYFMYCEEADMQFKIARNNYKRVIYNKPQIIHLEGKSSKISNNKRIFLYVSTIKYMRKNINIYKYFTVKYLYILLMIIDSLLNIIRKEFTLIENVKFINKLLKEEY